MASFQALCEVVNEFAKNENSKVEIDESEKGGRNSLKQLIEEVLKNEGLSDSLDVETVHQSIIKRNLCEKKVKKPFVCSYCNSTWDKSSALEKHLRVHTNIRPHECKLCKLNFKTKSNLYKHCKSKVHLSKIVDNHNTYCSSNSTPSTAPKINALCVNNNNNINVDTSISANDSSNKVMLLALPSNALQGYIISIAGVKPVVQEATSPPVTSDLKHKKPQILNLDSLKRKLLPCKTQIQSLKATPITKHNPTITNMIQNSPNNNLKIKLNDYINNLITRNEYIKQNMPQLIKPKEVKITSNEQVSKNRDGNNKKFQKLLLGHNYASLNMIHTTFSFNYEGKENKISLDNKQKEFELNNDQPSHKPDKPDAAGLIYAHSKASSNSTKLIHSSHNYGLTNTAKLDQYQNDVKNLIHLAPLHKEDLNKLVEPIFKDPNSIPKPLYQWGRKTSEIANVRIRGRGNGRYECIECGIRTKKPSMLKKHIRSHANLRPYVCKHCNLSFKTKGNLVKHMKTKAHLKKISDDSKNNNRNTITLDNIDNIALKRQEEIEKRLIFKDELKDESKNNNKKRRLNDTNVNLTVEEESDYFESVQDVAKSLLNLSKSGCEELLNDEGNCCSNSIKLSNEELENIGHLCDTHYKSKMCSKEHSLPISQIMSQLFKENTLKEN